MRSFRKYGPIKVFSSPRLTVYFLIILSVLVIWGTLYQAEHGLHAAQERFFQSWILMGGGFFPFPGTKLIVLLLTINLIAAFICRLSFRLKSTGVLLMHIGTALLFAAGVLSDCLVTESVLSLTEGDSASQSLDYRNWELSVMMKKPKPAKSIVESRKLSDLRAGGKVLFKEADFELTVEKIYKNCNAFSRVQNRIDSIAPLPLSANAGINVPGVVGFVKDGAPQRLLIFGGAGEPASFKRGDDSVFFSVHPLLHTLPIQIELVNFTKKNHPGTSIARDYRSRIRAVDGKEDREVVISMNRPFRYGAFTFYQTGYKDKGGKNISILAVVENPVRQMPYISCVIIMIGMVVHFLLQFKGAVLKRSRGES